MINLRYPILLSSIFFLVFVSLSFMLATPSFAARVGHSLVHKDITNIPEYKEPEETEIPEEPELPEEPEIPEEPELPEEPEIPEEPEVPEEPEIPEPEVPEPEVPEEPEEPEEPPKEPEEPNFGFPSWIPSFPFPGVNGGSSKSEKTKPTATVEEVTAKKSSVSEETSSGSNKKP